MNTSDERVWEQSQDPSGVYPSLDDYSRALLEIHMDALPQNVKAAAWQWVRNRPILNSFGFWSDANGSFQMKQFWTPKSEQHL